ncbi:MAG: LptF/LptG family permease [Wenzhouxiangellaceae bacterium]|nr:LptF/LptG family permease [Wenzhouxiangellaceae bacterium]
MTAHGTTLRRYLLREALVACGMTLMVLVAIMLALFLAELMGDVADGEVFAGTVLELLVLRIPEALVTAAPLALVVGLLMSFGELAQGEEFSVMRTAGMQPGAMLGTVLLLAVVWAVAVLGLSGWAVPAANQRAAALTERAADELLLAGVRPGRFESFGGLTVHAERVNAASRRLEGVFVHFTNAGRAEVITARTGTLLEHPETGRQILSLRDGVHLGHSRSADGMPFRRVEFERNDIELPVGRVAAGAGPSRAAGMLELAAAGDRASRIELLQRLTPFVISLVLVVFALPVTLVGGRGSRFAIALVAVAVYLAYSNTASLVLVRAAADNGPPGMVWLVHLAALTAALAIVVSWWRRW